MASDPESSPAYGDERIAVPSRTSDHYQFVAVTAIAALRLLAKRYGRPEGGGVVLLPAGYEWTLAAEAIRQMEGIGDAD